MEIIAALDDRNNILVTHTNLYLNNRKIIFIREMEVIAALDNCDDILVTCMNLLCVNNCKIIRSKKYINI